MPATLAMRAKNVASMLHASLNRLATEDQIEELAEDAAAKLEDA
jgi:hypothetical protein